MRRKPVAEIQRPEIARLHLFLKDKPCQANRVLALLSKFFNWCERHGYRADGSNPCRHVEKYREHRRERFLSAPELAKLGKALADAESEKTASPYVIAAIRLLALTGARLSEILTLKWDYVDFENAALRLPDSKTGQKSIYLNAPAPGSMNPRRASRLMSSLRPLSRQTRSRGLGMDLSSSTR